MGKSSLLRGRLSVLPLNQLLSDSDSLLSQISPTPPSPPDYAALLSYLSRLQSFVKKKSADDLSGVVDIVSPLSLRLLDGWEEEGENGGFATKRTLRSRFL